MADLSATVQKRAYTDIDFGFRSNPITGDVSLKRDDQAVKQSVLNILLTKKGERPFDPNFGSRINSLLFENFDPIVGTLLDEEIRRTLRNYEPRIAVENIDISTSPDRNAIDISLTVEIKSPRQTRTTVDFSIERLR